MAVPSICGSLGLSHGAICILGMHLTIWYQQHLPEPSPAGHQLASLVSGCTEARGPLVRHHAGCQGQEKLPGPRSLLLHVRAPRCAH